MATALVISISAKMASRFKTVTLEVTELKKAAENLNTRKILRSGVTKITVFEEYH